MITALEKILSQVEYLKLYKCSADELYHAEFQYPTGHFHSITDEKDIVNLIILAQKSINSRKLNE